MWQPAPVGEHQADYWRLPKGWAELHAGQGGATPFMHPGWAEPWGRHYGDGAKPFIIEVEGGIAALVLRRRHGQRVLEPWGIGPGDYWDVLAPPGRRDVVARAAAGVLASRAREWDAALLRCLPPDSPVQWAWEKDVIVGLRRSIPSPTIELPDTFDAYLGMLPKARRQNIRRHLRRLDGGEVTLREVTDPVDLQLAFDRWQLFRRDQWSTAGKAINGEHLSDRFKAFLLEVAGHLVPAGHALVWELSHRGDPVGVYVNFVDAESFHWYLGGFDPRVARLGLGKIAIVQGIRTSIETGRRRFDFGRGAEEYKYWYGARDRLLGAFVAGSRRPRSRFVLAAARVMASRR
jgi:CelD/BcsL family acetyltransferase involved in cellulose biosynthesis